MKSKTDSYFELLPVLVIALILILTDQGQRALRQSDIGPMFVNAPEVILESPRLIFR